MKTASLIFLCLSVSCIALPEDLDLAKDGATPYQIVKSDDASPVDEYAAGKLAEYLKQITGVEFAVVGPKKMDEGPSIFVGLSGPAVKLLGEDAGAGLKDQEHVSRSIGKS
ncbi:MAG: hypothetical protein QF473_12450, partial [Planctomycetota bacterium]|nr:hypothetical protein [Planctomycetota bacterium]